MDNLPLLELFTRLREAGLPLGVDDYEAALEALQAGFGIGDRAALARLCRTLWVKSEEDRRLFDYHFDRSIFPETKSSTLAVPSLNLIPVSEPSTVENITIEPLNLRQIAATLGIYALSVGIVVLPYVLSAFSGRTNHSPIFKSLPVEKAVYGKSYKYEIKAEEIDLQDKLTIQAWFEFNGQKTQITEQGTETDNSEPESLNCPLWLKFKDRGNGTAMLYGTVKKSETRKDSNIFTSTCRIKLQVNDQHGGSALQTFKINETDESSKGKPFHILELLLIWAAIPIGLYVIYRRSQTSTAQDSSDLFSSADPPTAPEASSASETFSEATDQSQLASPTPQLSQQLSIVSRPLFRQSNEYFPLTRRQMKQSWRFLRRMARTGAPTELDVEATLSLISRQGILLEPVLVPRRVNQSRLLLLIDQDSSMVPFHALSARLSETAVRGGRLASADVYYFHNCPIEYLYGDRYFHQAETIDTVLNEVQSLYTGVLIFSDAGAARGSLNAERLELTATFLTTLKRRVRYIAWLNPVPSSRWIGTTASQIARCVPMFELNRRGLDQAISVLRGRSG